MHHGTKGFTLIEMLIVIIIVAILMTIVMAFGGDFIRDIQARQIREEWVADYTMMRGKLLLSSYDNGVAVSGVELSFDDGTMIQTVTSKNQETSTHTYAYSGMTIEGPSMTISLEPYRLACDLHNDKKDAQSSVDQDVMVEITRKPSIRLTFDASEKDYCYHIDPHTCKISRLASCPSVE